MCVDEMINKVYNTYDTVIIYIFIYKVKVIIVNI